MALEVKWSESKLNKNLDRMGVKLGTVVLMWAATHASQLEAKMKTNRPWTDRTNMAKVTLSAKVSQPTETLIRITLAHGVNYGLWLELANEKNYAIIGPTIDIEGPRVVEDLHDLMSRLAL